MKGGVAVKIAHVDNFWEVWLLGQLEVGWQYGGDKRCQPCVDKNELAETNEKDTPQNVVKIYFAAQNKLWDEAVYSRGDVKHEFPTFKKISRPWCQGLWFGKKMRKKVVKKKNNSKSGLASSKFYTKININLTNHSKVRGKVLANCKHLTEEYV